MAKVEKFDHEVTRVHVLQSSSGSPLLVCANCCDDVKDSIHWHFGGIHVGVFALPDGRYLHVGEQADVGMAPKFVEVDPGIVR